MRRIIPYAGSLFLWLATLAAHAAGDSRAVDLLKQARAALGGDSALARVQGLSCEGTFHRIVGDRDLNGELRLDLQLPDKMLRTETMNPMGDATIVMGQGVNGDRLIRSARTLGGGPNMIVRLAPPGGPDGDAQALRSAHADLARLTLGMLLAHTSDVEVSYGGEAESNDGKADMLEAKGPGSFAARLFLDKTTHQPLMLTYRGVAPRMAISTVQHGDPHAAERMQNAEREAAHAELVDIAIYFEDYRSVDGILLPHHLSRAVDGKTTEEWTFKAFHMNPDFKPDTFSPK